MTLFLGVVALAAIGILGIVRLARGKPAVSMRFMHGVFAPSPSRSRSRSRRRGAGSGPHLLVAGVAAALVVVVTRWPLAGVATLVVVWLWPRLSGGGAVGRRQLVRIEALAAWTEALRDTSTAAAGLEQAIPATVNAAQPVLRPAVRELAARLDGRIPLPEALARFADDVDDPAADMVVAALSLNARQRAGGLQRILTALAASSRVELEMRRKVELERRALRRQARWIVIAVLGFALLQALFAPGWVQPYSTTIGQLVLAALMAVFLGAFLRMRSLAASRPEPRFLTQAERVTEIASFKPDLHMLGERP